MRPNLWQLWIVRDPRNLRVLFREQYSSMSSPFSYLPQAPALWCSTVCPTQGSLSWPGRSTRARRCKYDRQGALHCAVQPRKGSSVHAKEYQGWLRRKRSDPVQSRSGAQKYARPPGWTSFSKRRWGGGRVLSARRRTANACDAIVSRVFYVTAEPDHPTGCSYA